MVLAPQASIPHAVTSFMNGYAVLSGSSSPPPLEVCGLYSGLLTLLTLRDLPKPTRPTTFASSK